MASNMNGMTSHEAPLQEGDPSGDPLDQWRICASQQERVLRALLAERESLNKQLEDINFENYTMKTTIHVLRKETQEARSLAEKLEAKLDEADQAAPSTPRNLILTLLDGDGYIFHSDLLKKGEAGGREAATLLHKGIIDYVSAQPDRTSKYTLWTMIFLSKECLEKVLNKTNSCTPEEFKFFIKGFSQALPLFSFVEVGATKEAADYKIREHLTEFVGNPQIYKVFLGVDHDNGYGTMISTSLTAGHQERLVLLRAHKTIVPEIARLELKMAYIEGLFQDEKLSMAPPPMVRPSGSGSYARAASSPSPSTASASSLTSPSAKAYVLPAKRDSKPPRRDPAPCNFHYLQGYCSRKGIDCPYGHEYELLDQEIQSLKVGAKQQPCKYVNQNEDCHLADCIYGHECPRGRQCHYYASGRCKFVGEGMHDV